MDIKIKKKNILTRENVLESSKLNNSGLSLKQAEFLFKILEDTFGEVLMPDNEELADSSKIHPIYWMLIDYTGKELRNLFQLSLEISIVKNIPNHETVLKEIIKTDKYVGRRAEIYFGARIRTATPDVKFLPKIR